MASTDSNARAKKLKFYTLKILQDFESVVITKPSNASGKEAKANENISQLMNEKQDFLLKIREFKPNNVKVKILRVYLFANTFSFFFFFL